MIKGIGIDIESIDRIGTLVARYDADTLQMIFTAGELQRCQGADETAQHFTICFVAKEAMGKALGTGLATIDWHEIEVNVQDNQINITLHGKALQQAMSIGVSDWSARWSSCNNQVTVLVVIQA
jgi:holo-[acyl-carrier protein] synthase